MLVETPFSRPGRFWRGNLHTHSTLSDGHRSPEEVCRFYETAGYDFLALTEHFLEHYGWPLVDTRPYRSAAFTTILGAELHPAQDRMEFGRHWHILAVGLPLDFAPSPLEETGPELARRALAAGAFVVAAHPQWHTMTDRDVTALGPIHALESSTPVALTTTTAPTAPTCSTCFWRGGSASPPARRTTPTSSPTPMTARPVG
jgi:hypothetical protein